MKLTLPLFDEFPDLRKSLNQLEEQLKDKVYIDNLTASPNLLAFDATWSMNST